MLLAMKAAYRTRYGDPEVLSVRELPVPAPGPQDLLVRVRAATVNRTDCGALWGRPFVYRFFAGFPHPRHTATGTDFAGDVEAVGERVADFKVGDRVFGFDDNGAGSHAQFVTFPATKGVQTIPAHVSYEDAVTAIEGAHYALNFLNKLDLEPGQRVLVNGATGAIGSAAVQLAKHQGLVVTAVCGPEHVDLVASLGADRVIDRSKHDFTREDITYDFIFDSVGKSTFGACKPILSSNGVYISSELGPRAENPFLALVTRLRKGKRVVFPFPVDIPASLRHMRQLLEDRSWRPVIDRRHPLEEIREAFTYVASGQKIGNVLLTFD